MKTTRIVIAIACFITATLLGADSSVPAVPLPPVKAAQGPAPLPPPQPADEIIIAQVVQPIVPPTAAASPAGNATQRAVTTQPVGPADANGKTLRIILGTSQVIRPPWPVARVAVTNPKVADLQVLSPRQVLVQGKGVGMTDLTMWSDNEEVWHAPVHVEIDPQSMQLRLKQLFPDSQLAISQQDGVVSVQGTLSRAEHAPQLHQFLDAYGIKYADLTSVAGVHQVLLQVRFAEVSRKAIRALGFNALYTGNDFFGGITVGSSGGGPLNPISIGQGRGTIAQSGAQAVFTQDVGVSPAVTVFGGSPTADFQFFLEALVENQYMRILAEPNLVAISGQDASFLAGGEFPIPVVQGSTAGGGTAITVEYRKFGIQLKFRPTVLGDGTIRLHVAPEVSELTDNGAVVLQGFRIPALMTRQAETTLELKSRQTFAMAGLISHTATGRSSRIPGAGDLPVIGALFRSIRYEKGETELVVLVTASLIEPTSAISHAPLPGALHFDPNDWEFYGLARLEGSPPNIGHQDATMLQECGLHRLKGPGAWAKYESSKATPSADNGNCQQVSPTRRTARDRNN